MYIKKRLWSMFVMTSHKKLYDCLKNTFSLVLTRAFCRGVAATPARKTQHSLQKHNWPHYSVLPTTEVFCKKTASRNLKLILWRTSWPEAEVTTMASTRWPPDRSQGLQEGLPANDLLPPGRSSGLWNKTLASRTEIYCQKSSYHVRSRMLIAFCKTAVH